MLTGRDKYYLREDFGAIDMGLTAVLGHSLLDVYRTLRRFVWRGTETGDPEVMELYRRGELVAYISQRKLGEHVGLGVRQTNAIIARLRKLGFLEVRPMMDPTKGLKIYVMGRVTVDDQGRRHERFTADVTLQILHDYLTGLAQERFGLTGSLHSFRISERIALLNEFIGRLEPRTSSQRPEGQPHAADCVGGTQSVSGGVRSRTHAPHAAEFFQKESKGDGKVENDEETKERNGRLAPTVPWTDDFSKPEAEEKTCESNCDVDPASRTSDEGPASARRSAEPDVLTQCLRTREERLRTIFSSTDGPTNAGEVQTHHASQDVIGRLLALWKRLHETYFPGQGVQEPERFGKEGRMVRQLVKRWDETLVSLAMEYMFAYWDRMRERFKGARSRPFVGFLLQKDNEIFHEAQTYDRSIRTIAQVRRWCSVSDDPLPTALAEQYERAVKDLELLGIEPQP